MAGSIYDTSGVATPAQVPTEPKKGGNFWEALGAGGWGALNSALFNIPEYIAKHVAPSDTYKALQSLVERNKGAFTAGQIAGMFVPTGGLAAKGVATGLKGAKAVLQAAKLGKAAESVAKGVKALDTAGDIIRGTKAVSGVGGMAARGALSAAEQAVPRAFMDLSEGKDLGSVIKDVGTASLLGGGVGGALGGLGKAKQLIGKYAPEIAEAGEKGILTRVGVTDRAVKKGIFGTEMPEIAGDVLGKKAATQGELLAEYAPQMRKAAVATLTKNKATSPIDFKNLIGEASEADIQKLIRAANPGIADDVAAQTATMLKHSAGMAEASLGEGRELLSGLGGLAKNPLMTAAIAGGGLGAVKDIAEGKDLKLGSTLQNALIGAGAIKFGPKLLAKIAPALEKAATAELPGAVGKIATRTAEAAMKAPGILGSRPTAADEAKIEKISETEATVSPEGQEQAQFQISEKYAARIAENIQQAWLSRYAAQGVPYDEFVRALAARTDNFDPKKSAAILFQDKAERAKFLKDYETALKLQSMDVEAAYKGKKANAITEFFGGGDAAVARMNYSNLVDAVAGTLAAQGSLPTATEKKAVEADLDKIMALPASAGDKRTLLLRKLADSYGLSLGMLEELGLV